MSDPLASRVIELLTRGHNLYAGGDIDAGPADAPERLRHHADRLGTVQHGTGAAAAATEGLAGRLRTTATVDAELAALLADAHTTRRLGRRATRAVLQAALADAGPGTDTTLGRREALSRMAARLRAQHRHIASSRQRSARLTRRLQQLAYPRAGRAAHALALPAVRYEPCSPPGRIRDRIARALDHLAITDATARRNWLRGYETLIARESGGRASAVASEPATEPGPMQPDGHRLGYARGLTQTIPATFAHFHQPNTSTNIYDPVANICASMNYVMHRYGVGADGANLVALVQQADRSRAPKGY
jgi:SLT domain-containing protein